jgi:hypothetical protein
MLCARARLARRPPLPYLSLQECSARGKCAASFKMRWEPQHESDGHCTLYLETHPQQCPDAKKVRWRQPIWQPLAQPLRSPHQDTLSCW